MHTTNSEKETEIKTNKEERKRKNKENKKKKKSHTAQPLPVSKNPFRKKTQPPPRPAHATKPSNIYDTPPTKRTTYHAQKQTENQHTNVMPRF